MNSFLGNEHLKAEFKNKGPSNTILLSGPSLIGKRTFAKILAKQILCNSFEKKPCNSCISCDKIAKDIHPDVKIYDFAEKQIPVSVAREICADSQVMPNESAYKVYIIAHADRLSSISQNALLKTLEEPEDFVRFILTCENVSALLPTVLSRCTVYHLAPLSFEDTVKALRSKYGNNENIEKVAQASSGVLGQAQNMLENENDSDILDVLEFVKAINSRSELKILDFLLTFEKKDRQSFKKFLQNFIFFLHSAISVDTDLGNEYFAFTDEAIKFLRYYNRNKIYKLYDYVTQLIIDCDFNASLSAMLAAFAGKIYEE